MPFLGIVIVINAAIFDMDGLLIDSERIIMQACIGAAKQVDITYTQVQYVQLIGRSGADSARRMVDQLKGEDNFNRVMQYVDAQLAHINNTFPVKAGALDLLKHYQAKNVFCSVVSSSTHHINHLLNQVNALHYLYQVTSGHEVINGKPSPDIYLIAVQKLGLTVSECIAFEDSEMGACAAIAAGLKVVVVPDLLQPREFTKEYSHKVVPNLKDSTASPNH